MTDAPQQRSHIWWRRRYSNKSDDMNWPESVNWNRMVHLIHDGNWTKLKTENLTAVFISWVSKVVSWPLWFCIISPCYWPKTSRHLINQSKVKTKTHRDLLAPVFSRLRPAIRFEFWLVHWIDCVSCGWSYKWRFWFYQINKKINHFI